MHLSQDPALQKKKTPNNLHKDSSNIDVFPPQRKMQTTKGNKRLSYLEFR